MQLELIERGPKESDVVYTPDKVAREIIAWLNPSGICLDPCLGDGAFFKHLPEGSDWCELRRGKNFFDYERRVDWIIGNPPYSLFEEWLRHSFELADNVAYILPTNKVFQRQVIMKMINEWGGSKGHEGLRKRGAFFASHTNRWLCPVLKFDKKDGARSGPRTTKILSVPE